MDRGSAGRTGRTRYDPDSLLEVAVKVFTERGYDGTSMEHLAKAAGITKSSFYHHVEGKEELLRRSLERAMDGLFAVLEEEQSLRGPAIVRLEHIMRRSVDLLIREHPHVTLLLRVRGNNAIEQHALERRREFQRAVTKLVLQAEEEGDLVPTKDARLTGRLVFGMINSMAEWYHPDGGLSSRALGDAVVQACLDGLRPRS